MKPALFLLATLTLAQSAIDAPLAGYAMDAAGRLHPVWGVAGNFVVGPVVLPDRVVEAAPESLRAVRQASGVAIMQADGAIVDSLPRASGPVLLLPRGASVFVAEKEIVVRRADASEVRFPLEGVLSLRLMGESYAQAATREAMYAVRITAGKEGIFILPMPKEHRR